MNMPNAGGLGCERCRTDARAIVANPTLRRSVGITKMRKSIAHRSAVLKTYGTSHANKAVCSVVSTPSL